MKDDVETRTSIESWDKTRRKKKKSWTKLLRTHKREDPVRKCGKIKGIRFPQEMMAPPEELAVMMEDVRRAKREIREISRAKTKTRELAKKALKSGLVPVLASSELDFNRCGFGILFTSDSIFVKLHRWPFITLIPHFNCDVIFLFTLIDDFFNFEICTENYIYLPFVIPISDQE